MVAFEFGVILALLLLVSSLILSSKLKIHYTLILVVLGFCISLFRYFVGVEAPQFKGELILGLILPTLIFQAALSIDFEVFREVKKRVFCWL
ncbi:MAG: cation:proton antiporter [Candidatus Bathyarchaeia archaeon]